MSQSINNNQSPAYLKEKERKSTSLTSQSLECQRVLESRIKSNVIYGIPINGFHPQLNASPNINYEFTPKLTDEFSSKKRKLDDKTHEVMKILKIEEEARIRYRMETSEKSFRYHPYENKTLGHTDVYSICKRESPNVQTHPQDARNAQIVSSNLFESSFRASLVPQIIANSDGRIKAWNNAFLQLSGYSDQAVTKYLSIFCMADQAFLPKLFDLFSSVLRENEPPPDTSSHDDSEKHEATYGDPTQREHKLSPSRRNQLAWSSKLSKIVYYDEKNLFDNQKHPNYDSNTSKKRRKFGYSSLTIPCRQFRTTDRFYNMKVTYMSDWDPTRRCFHCTLSPIQNADSESQSRGSIINEPISIGT